jgi:bifunctional UDP-N-acetylglucosamine pyrophosphorylase/glucosamine-1-phosphate N-acetyltransferase
MKNALCILAAGKGKRMLSALPKVLMPLQGRPLLEYLLSSVFSLDLEKLDSAVFVLVSPDNQEIIKKHFPDLPIHWVIQENALGTGHAAQVFSDYCQKNKLDFEKVLFLYGDHPLIKSETINDLLLSEELSVEQPLLMLTTKREGEFSTIFEHWGRILRNQNREIIGVREYRDSSLVEKELLEVNPGLMLFDFVWLNQALPLLNNQNVAQEYYLTDLPALAIKQNKKVLSREIAPSEVLGVNTPQELSAVEKFLTEKP